MTLTPKQELFCNEYLIDLNATQAAIRAGYSAKGANSKGAQLLANVSIAQKIASLKAQRNEEVSVSAAYVLKRLIEIDQMDVLDILRDDGTLKPISEWPKCWRTTLSGMDISTTIQNYDETTTETILKKIKWPDKVKNLELLGRHVDVQAWRDQAKVDHSINELSDLMDELSGGA